MKWLDFGLTVLRGRWGLLAAPFKLTFIVTKECHSKCQNCNIWKVKPQNELTLEEIRRLAEKSPFLSWVHFAGGEPTDRADFPEIAAAFREKCPNLAILNFPTNGLKPKRIEEQVRRISALKVPKFGVTVSVDGPRDINDKLRGIPGDFQRAVETINRLRSIAGVEVYAGMTIYRENLALITETISALQQQIPGFKERDLHINLAHTSPHYYENTETSAADRFDPSPAVRQIIAARGRPRSAADLLEKMYHANALDYLEHGKTPVSCAALYASCYLSETGEVYPCSIWDKPLGNIRNFNYSLLPILRSAADVRQEIVKKNCPNCWTPCEAYQSLLVSSKPLQLLKQVVS